MASKEKAPTPATLLGDLRQAAAAIQVGWMELQTVVNSIRPGFPKIREAFANLIEGIGAVMMASKKLDKAGWLPHYTTPLSALSHPEVSALSQAIGQHYRANWPLVKKQFVDRLDLYAVDDEAKATFHEALASHEQGHYRATVRLLFPEIERVTRKELRDLIARIKKQRRERNKLNRKKGRGDNDDPLIEIAGTLTPREHGDDLLSLRLYIKLRDHLYSSSAPSATLCLDPVPNRHAAMHGFVTYSTAQNSINALIMTDYIFRLVTVVNLRRHRALKNEGGSV